LTPYWFEVVRLADAASQQFGSPLSDIRSTELYLVEGVAEVAGPVTSANGSMLGVIYPPEFVFVLDAGLPALVGGVVSWYPVAYGDPGFPQKNRIVLRSIPGRTEDQIIFPNVVGSLMIGLKQGSDTNAAKQALLDAGLRDVQVSDLLATASCAPFKEADLARRLEADLPFVKYAEPNGVQRLVDFSPGWVARRLI
jgi:hypothetical protein